uniref:Uncharacterized protein n=1 Tax=Strongyloides papillosus TaxID=174720 RepID=A0A0N5BIX4_STREA
MFYGGGYGGYGGGGMYGGCTYGYGYGCGLFDWDISYWIYLIIGLIVFFLIICLLCSPCCCTALAACLAGAGFKKKRSSKDRNVPIQQVQQPPPQPTIITTQPIVTGTPAHGNIITQQPIPSCQKNITIYESSDKPIPKERKKKDYGGDSEIIAEDHYYSSKRQRLPRTSPYVDRVQYSQQNQSYYADRR